MDFDNTNSGILHRNLNKTEPKQPDFSGTINVEGVEYWLNGWVKDAKPDGKLAQKGIKQFFSLSLRPKNDAPKVEPAKGFADIDSDLPF